MKKDPCSVRPSEVKEAAYLLREVATAINEFADLNVEFSEAAYIAIRDKRSEALARLVALGRAVIEHKPYYRDQEGVAAALVARIKVLEDIAEQQRKELQMLHSMVDASNTCGKPAPASSPRPKYID